MNGNKIEACNLALIRERIEQKRQDYIKYDFSPKKNDILKTFFDLAQEFDSIPDLFRICVSIPQEALGVDAKLYLLDDSGVLAIVCDSQYGVYENSDCEATNAPLPQQHIRLSNEPYEIDQSFVVPIFCKSFSITEHEPGDISNVVGMLEIMPLDKLTKDDKFFFTKYTNRIGYNLRKKSLAQHNINHLKFINNLVNDIEHNVIVPNMHYKSLFNQLKRDIENLNELSRMIEEYKKDENSDHRMCKLMGDKIIDIKTRLNSSYEDIDKHHINLSLFLESLLRRDHFEKGYFVLRPRNCKLDSDIIAPQLENYEKRMLMRGIEIEKPADMRGEEIEINADLGLLSQVYANLFSNALKYTQKVVGCNGETRKVVTYGRKIIKDYFGKGEDGIKLNVFSTGDHIPAQESKYLFNDGFIGANKGDDLSRGHGLAFIKYVVEMHGGVVGYEPTGDGNNFYFILPLVKH